MQINFAGRTCLTSARACWTTSIYEKLVLFPLFWISFAHQPLFLASTLVFDARRWRQNLFVRLQVFFQTRLATVPVHVVFRWGVPRGRLLFTAFGKLLGHWRPPTCTLAWFQVWLTCSQMVDFWQSSVVSGLSSMAAVDPTSQFFFATLFNQFKALFPFSSRFRMNLNTNG